MTPQNDEQDALDRLVAAYDRMLERVHDAIEDAEQSALPNLRNRIDAAREKAVELGELTREEADRIASYLQRDLHDAADYLHDTGEELGSWLRFDLQLIERRLLDMFASVADRTQLELAELAERARQASLYHTGEITGPGTLYCSSCGKAMRFHKAGRIPPCPDCHATAFQRGPKKA